MPRGCHDVADFALPPRNAAGITRNDPPGPNPPGTPRQSMQVRVVPRSASKRPGKVRIPRSRPAARPRSQQPLSTMPSQSLSTPSQISVDGPEHQRTGMGVAPNRSPPGAFHPRVFLPTPDSRRRGAAGRSSSWHGSNSCSICLTIERLPGEPAGTVMRGWLAGFQRAEVRATAREIFVDSGD